LLLAWALRLLALLLVVIHPARGFRAPFQARLILTERMLFSSQSLVGVGVFLQPILGDEQDRLAPKTANSFSQLLFGDTELLLTTWT
jgi:hypothetical protein